MEKVILFFQIEIRILILEEEHTVPKMTHPNIKKSKISISIAKI